VGCWVCTLPRACVREGCSRFAMSRHVQDKESVASLGLWLSCCRAESGAAGARQPRRPGRSIPGRRRRAAGIKGSVSIVPTRMAGVWHAAGNGRCSGAWASKAWTADLPCSFIHYVPHCRGFLYVRILEPTGVIVDIQHQLRGRQNSRACSGSCNVAVVFVGEGMVFVGAVRQVTESHLSFRTVLFLRVLC
jgi:hypothetical protein